MNHFEIIRQKVLLGGMRPRDVARELGHSRKTVAKAMEHRLPPGYQMVKVAFKDGMIVRVIRDVP